MSVVTLDSCVKSEDIEIIIKMRNVTAGEWMEALGRLS